MADASPSPGRWAFRPLPPEPRSVVELIRAGTLDARAGRDAVAADRGAGPDRRRGRGAGCRASPRSSTPCSCSCRPASGRSSSPARPRPSTGCRRPPSSAGRGPRTPAPSDAGDRRRQGRRVRPDDTVLLVPELSDHLPVLHVGRGGPARHPRRVDRLRPGGDHPCRLARRGLRRPAPAAGRARRRRAVASRRRPRPAPRRRRPPPRRRRRTTSARPPATCTATSSASGPAVLATWDPPTDAFEHFGWGITPGAGAPRRPSHAGRLRARGRPAARPPRALVAAGMTDVDGVRARHRRRTVRRPFDASAGRRLGSPSEPRHSEDTVDPERTPSPSRRPSPSSAPRAGARAPSRTSCGPISSPGSRRARQVFPGVVGYEDSVVPAIENAILAGHDLVFLGERGQAKTRMARAARRPARRVAAGRRAAASSTTTRTRRSARRPARSSSATATRPPIDWLAARPPLRREARDARHHHRRPDRRGRPDQGRRGPLPVRRADAPLRPDPARQPRHRRHQRAARPRRADPGRPAQHPRGARRPDPRLRRPPAARPVRGRLGQPGGLHLARPDHHAAQGPPRVADPDPLPADPRRRDGDRPPGEAPVRGRGRRRRGRRARRSWRSSSPS